MDPAKCVVLVPVAKSLEPETEAALTQLAASGYPVRMLRGGSQVDLVRSALASQAVRGGYDETLWIDSDVVFTPADVERIREHAEPIVAGLYVKKDRNEFACQFDGHADVKFGLGGGLLKMRGVGMGFTRVLRGVYEEVKRVHGLPDCGGGYDPAETVTPYFLPMVEGATYLSEDYSFCRRAQAAGFDVWADTRLKLGHVHRHVRTWDDVVERPKFDSLDVQVR